MPARPVRLYTARSLDDDAESVDLSSSYATTFDWRNAGESRDDFLDLSISGRGGMQRKKTLLGVSTVPEQDAPRRSSTWICVLLVVLLAQIGTLSLLSLRGDLSVGALLGGGHAAVAHALHGWINATLLACAPPGSTER